MVVLYFLLVALVFGALVFIHEFGHFITARLCGVSVKEFAIGMGPKLISWQSKKYETRYALRLLPFGGFVSMEGEDESSDSEGAYCNKSIWKRMLIVLAGPVMNLILGFVLMTVMVFIQGPLASTTVAEFQEGATSNQVLQEGDRILEVDGTRVHTGNEMVYEIMNQGFEPIDLVVVRDGKEITLKDVTFPTIEDSGVTFGDYDFIPYAEDTNLPNLCKHAFWRSVSNVKMVYDSIFGLISGRYGMDAISGPVGVAEVVGDAAKIGLDSFLYIVSVLSVNLGIFNLLPVPALDGGRFVFHAIEGGFRLCFRGRIRRDAEAFSRFMRRLHTVESYINSVSLVLLFALMIFVTAKDILNLFV